MKAILINVKNQSVTQIEMSDDYNEIYTHIGNGCRTFEVPVEFDNGDVLYVDEEGLLQPDKEGAFIMSGWNRPIVGNALIIGADAEGNSVDAKTNADDVARIIRFMPKNIAEEYAKVALSGKQFIVHF